MTCCPTCGQNVANEKKLLIDYTAKRLAYKEHTVTLTMQQLEILQVLQEAAPRGVKWEDIALKLTGLWTEEVGMSRASLHVQLHHIRKRIKGTGIEVRPSYGCGFTLVLN